MILLHTRRPFNFSPDLEGSGGTETAFDADAAFFGNLGVSEEPEEEELHEDPGTGDGAGGDEGGDGNAPDGDDPELELLVGDKPEKIKTSELVKLYQQRAELEATAARSAAEIQKAQGEYTKANSALTKMLEKANERLGPYQKLDYFLLAQRMEPEAFSQLRADAEAAYNDVQFLQSELDVLVQNQRNEFAQAHQQAAVQAVAVLQDPEKGIPGFNKAVYEDIIGYATAQGVPREVALQVIDVPALKMMHKAMLYDRAQQNVAQKVQPSAGSPKRVMRPASADSTPASKTGFSKALDNLKNNRSSMEAAEAAFLASLGD